MSAVAVDTIQTPKTADDRCARHALIYDFSMGLLIIAIGCLIGVVFRYVLKRPGVRDEAAPRDPRRWSSWWF